MNYELSVPTSDFASPELVEGRIPTSAFQLPHSEFPLPTSSYSP